MLIGTSLIGMKPSKKYRHTHTHTHTDTHTHRQTHKHKETQTTFPKSRQALPRSGAGLCYPYGHLKIGFSKYQGI